MTNSSSNRGVTTKEVNASAEAAVAGAVDVALKVEFQFDGRKPAAALVMYKPRYISLPNDERIIKLLKSRPDVLKGKYIVTDSVISCAVYVMYMYDQKAEKFSVTLKATGPTGPAVNTGGAIGFTWTSENISGIYRAGSDSAAKYMPLYSLVLSSGGLSVNAEMSQLTIRSPSGMMLTHLGTPSTMRTKKTKSMMQRCMVTSAFSMTAILITTMTYDHSLSPPHGPNRANLYVDE